MSGSRKTEENFYNAHFNNDGAYYKIPFSRFFQFGVSVDCVVFGYEDSKLKLLLIKRGAEPYKGDWALPGDLVYPNEDIEVAALRILKDLTGIENLFMEQTMVYGKVDRHPAGRVITNGYYSLIDIAQYNPTAAGWAQELFWVDLKSIQHLAFDHTQIVADALKILQEKVRRQPIGFELLPQKFALSDLQSLYEAFLSETFDKANFRKKILSMKILNELDEVQNNVSHRPGRLYSFNASRYQQLSSKGFSFEL